MCLDKVTSSGSPPAAAGSVVEVDATFSASLALFVVVTLESLLGVGRTVSGSLSAFRSVEAPTGTSSPSTLGGRSAAEADGFSIDFSLSAPAVACSLASDLLLFRSPIGRAVLNQLLLPIVGLLSALVDSVESDVVLGRSDVPVSLVSVVGLLRSAAFGVAASVCVGLELGVSPAVFASALKSGTCNAVATVDLEISRLPPALLPLKTNVEQQQSSGLWKQLTGLLRTFAGQIRVL